MIHDARQLSPDKAMALHRNGFELREAAVNNYDFMDHDEVVARYYHDCEEIVGEAPGGNVWAFDHNIRSASGSAEKRQVKGGQDVQGPAHIVHGDYTLRSGPERLRQLTRPPGVNDTLRSFIPAGKGLIPSEIAEKALGEDECSLSTFTISPLPVLASSSSMRGAGCRTGRSCSLITCPTGCGEIGRNNAKHEFCYP